MGIFCGSVVQRMNFTCGGGSSSVFSSALKAGRRQHVNFVNDVNLEPRATGPHIGIGPQLPDLVDPAIAGTVDLDHVHVLARVDRLSRCRCRCPDRESGRWAQFRALAKIRAVDVLPTPRAPGEQIGVTDPMGRDRVHQRLSNLLLAHQVVKRFGAVTASDHHVRTARDRRRVRSGGESRGHGVV